MAAQERVKPCGRFALIDQQDRRPSFAGSGVDQHRHFTAAGRAPTGPEVEHGGTAAQIACRYAAALRNVEAQACRQQDRGSRCLSLGKGPPHCRKRRQQAQSRRNWSRLAQNHDHRQRRCNNARAPLDGVRALAVIDLLNSMARQFATAIIVVTHDEKIIPTFRRLYNIRDGVTIEEGQDGASADPLGGLPC